MKYLLNNKKEINEINNSYFKQLKYNKPDLTLLYFNLFILIISIQYVLNKQDYFVLLISISSFSFLWWKYYHHWKLLILIFIGCNILFILNYYLNHHNFKDLYNLIRQQTNYLDLRTQGINYIKNNYEPNNASLLNLLIFNYKNYKSSIYQAIIDINIASIFVVSGIHINSLIALVNWCFKLFKNKTINIIKILVNLVIIGFLFYLTSFSISALRILIYFLITTFNKKINNIQKLSLSGLIIWIISANDTSSYSFILSYLCVFNVIMINELFKDKLLVQTCLIQIWLNLITLPIIISFNNQFNILSIFFNFIFSYVILLFYLLALLFCWLPFLIEVFNSISSIINNLILNIFNQNQLIKVNYNSIISTLIYLGWSILINLNIIKCFRTIDYKKNPSFR